MFKHVIILKVSPWFLYADSEKDALKTCEPYKENVAGIVIGDNLIVKEAKFRMTLDQDEVFQIPYQEAKLEEPTQNLDDEQIRINMEQASKELEDEFNKLQP